MTTSRMSLDFTPRGWLTVTPRIVVPDARGLVKFIQDVFGATGDYRSDTPAILHIGGDSMIMVSDAGALYAIGIGVTFVMVGWSLLAAGNILGGTAAACD